LYFCTFYRNTGRVRRFRWVVEPNAVVDRHPRYVVGLHPHGAHLNGVFYRVYGIIKTFPIWKQAAHAVFPNCEAAVFITKATPLGLKSPAPTTKWIGIIFYLYQIHFVFTDYFTHEFLTRDQAFCLLAFGEYLLHWLSPFGIFGAISSTFCLLTFFESFSVPATV